MPREFQPIVGLSENEAHTLMTTLQKYFGDRLPRNATGEVIHINKYVEQNRSFVLHCLVVKIGEEETGLWNVNDE